MIGYIGRINEADVKALEQSEDLSNYKGSDHIGKAGIEHVLMKNSFMERRAFSKLKWMQMGKRLECYQALLQSQETI